MLDRHAMSGRPDTGHDPGFQIAADPLIQRSALDGRFFLQTHDANTPSSVARKRRAIASRARCRPFFTPTSPPAQTHSTKAPPAPKIQLSKIASCERPAKATWP